MGFLFVVFGCCSRVRFICGCGILEVEVLKIGFS